MRIRLVFILKNKGGLLPFHHQHIVSELLENVMSNSGFDFPNYQVYTFSGLKGETKVGKNGLHFFSDKVTLVFGSPNCELIELLVKQVFSFNDLMLGELLLVPLKAVEERELEFDESNQTEGGTADYVKQKYVCLSPIVVRPPDNNPESKQFISPENDYFSDLLYESTMVRMERSGLYAREQISNFYKFQVEPDAEYLGRVKTEEKKFARIYNTQIGNRPVEIRGYTLPFNLYAAPEVHNFIFNAGFGELCRSGYGMVDLTNQNFAKRTGTPYFQKGEDPTLTPPTPDAN